MRNIFTSLLAISVILSATLSFAKDGPKPKVILKLQACPADKKIIEKMTLIFTDAGSAQMTIKVTAGKWLLDEGNPKYSTEVYDIDTTKTKIVSVNSLQAYEIYIKDVKGTTSQQSINFIKFRDPKNIEKNDDSKDIINHYITGFEDMKAEYCK